MTVPGEDAVLAFRRLRILRTQRVNKIVNRGMALGVIQSHPLTQSKKKRPLGKNPRGRHKLRLRKGLSIAVVVCQCRRQDLNLHEHG